MKGNYTDEILLAALTKPMSVGEIASAVGGHIETVRAHMRRLVASGHAKSRSVKRVITTGYYGSRSVAVTLYEVAA